MSAQRGQYSLGDIEYKPLGADPIAAIEGEAQKYGLSVSKHGAMRSPSGNRAAGGSPTSRHLVDDARDLTGDPQKMREFYRHMRSTYGPNLKELYHDPEGGFKNGQDIAPIGGHSDHVHVSIGQRGQFKLADAEPASTPAPLRIARPRVPTRRAQIENMTDQEAPVVSAMPSTANAPSTASLGVHTAFEDAKQQGDLENARRYAGMLAKEGWEVGESDGWPYVKPPAGTRMPASQGTERFAEEQTRKPEASKSSSWSRGRYMGVTLPEPIVQGAVDVAAGAATPIVRAAQGVARLPGAIAEEARRIPSIPGVYTAPPQPSGPQIGASAESNPVEHWLGDASMSIEEFAHANGLPVGTAKELATAAGGLAPLLLLKRPLAIGGMTAAETYGRGESLPTSLRAGAEQAAVIGTMGGGARLLDEAIAGEGLPQAASRFAGRTAVNVAAPNVVRMATGQEPRPITPSEVVTGAGFALAHGAGQKPRSEASRRAPVSAPEPFGVSDVSKGQPSAERIPGVVLIPPGEPVSVPEGQTSTRISGVGTFVHGRDLTHADIRAAVREGRTTELLRAATSSQQSQGQYRLEDAEPVDSRMSDTIPRTPAEDAESAARIAQAPPAVAARPEPTIVSPSGTTRTRMGGEIPDASPEGQAALEGLNRRMQDLGPPTGQAERRRAEGKKTDGYKFSSTQVNLPKDQSAPVLAMGKAIPDMDLAADGRENEPHITVKYGLHTSDAEELRPLLASEKPIKVTLRKTKVFEGVEDGTADAVVAEVDSPDLHRLNKKIADALPHTDTHPDYKPHVTIAYVKPGLGKKYAGRTDLEGMTVTLNKITFSSKDKTQTAIPLAGAGESGQHPSAYQPRAETGEFVPGKPEYPVEDARGAAARRTSAYDKLVALRRQSEDQLFQASNLSATEIDRVKAKLEALKTEVTPKRPLKTVVEEYLRQGSLFGAHELNPGQQELLRDLASPTRRAKDTSEQGGLFGDTSPTVESRREQSQIDKAGPTFGQGGLFQGSSQMIGIFDKDGVLRGTASLSQNADPAKWVREQYGRGYTHGELTMESEGENPRTALMQIPKRSNVVYREARNFDSEILGYVAEPHDGTEAGIMKAAQKATSRMADEFPEASHGESRLRATDETGKPKWAISPNFRHLREIGTDEGLGASTLPEAKGSKQIGSGKLLQADQSPEHKLFSEAIDEFAKEGVTDFKTAVRQFVSEFGPASDYSEIFQEAWDANKNVKKRGKATFESALEDRPEKVKKSTEDLDLVQYIRNRGGIKMGSLKGEQAHMRESRLRQPGVFTKDGLAWDDMETALRSDGYLQEGESVLEALDAAARGEKRFANSASYDEQIEREWKEASQKEFAENSDHAIMARAFDNQNDAEYKSWVEAFDDIRQSDNPDSIEGFKHYSQELRLSPETINRLIDAAGEYRATESDRTQSAESRGATVPTDRASFQQGLVDHFRYSPETAETETAIADALISTLAKESGKSKESWYKTIWIAHGGQGAGLEQTDAPAFYSQLQRTLESQTQGRFTPEQLEAVLRKSVKPDEMKWTGFDDFLAEKKAKGERVTKEEALEFARQNAVEVREVTKDKPTTRLGGIGGYERAEVVKFGAYQIPGGENYRELLLTLPRRPRSLPGDAIVEPNKNAADFTNPFRVGWQVRSPKGVLGYGETRDAAIEAAKDYLAKNDLTGDLARNQEFKSSHFDEPNVLAHVRFNERTDAEGKRVLFIEEVQSDWHQKGRKQGYGSDTKAIEKEQDDYTKSLEEKYGTAWRPKATALEKAYWDELSQKIRDGQGGVPDAPFKTTWPDLAMKRMIRWAAENGFDKVAWTTGEQQAERYDLSKQVDAIRISGDPEQGVVIEAAPKDEGYKVIASDVPASKIEDHVGKEIAQKYAQGQNEFKGVDLKVGGEGMKGFYDKILPSVASKLGKKFGAKVGTTDIGATDAGMEAAPGFNFGVRLSGQDYDVYRTRGEAENVAGQIGGQIVDLKDGKGSLPVHSLDITDSMRASAMQGQPLFQGPRGMTSFLKTGQAVIRALQNPNESTALHEVHHALLPQFMRLTTQEGVSEQFGKDMGHMARWMNLRDAAHFNELHEQYQNGTLKGRELARYINAQEKGARGFEKYLRTGKAPTPFLEAAFGRLKEVLTNIYQNLKGSEIDIDIGPRQTAVWDRMLGGKGESGPKVTGIKNATVAEEREARGLDPVEQSLRRGFGQVLDEGKRLVDENPYFRESVVNDLIQNPRAPSDAEDAALAYDRMKLHNEHREALRDMEEAIKADDHTGVVQARYKMEAVESAIDLNDQAAKKAGTESGRSLNARKMMIRDDYSMATMIQKAKVAAREAGNALSPETEQTIRDMADKIADYESKLDARERYIAELESQKAREEKVSNWRAKIGRRPRSKAALDDELIRMQDHFALLARGGEPEKPRGGLFQADKYEGPFTDEMRKLIKDMARNRVEAGARTAENVNEQVHRIVSQYLPEVEARDVGDVWSEYGKVAKLSMEEIDVAMREAKRQERLLIALEDAQAGVSPARSGLQRDKMTPRVKELTKQIKKAMRDTGLIMEKAGPDPEKQWLSALKTFKTRTTNSIKEYQRRLDEGDYVTAKRKPLELDDGARALIRQRDAVKARYQRELEKLRPGARLRTLSALRKSWMLSGLSTQLKNTIGTGAYQVFDEASRMPAVIMDAAISPITGQRSITGSSPIAILDSIVAAGKIGGREFVETVKHGATAEQMAQHQFGQEIKLGKGWGEGNNLAAVGLNSGLKVVEVASKAVFRVMSGSDRVFYQGALKRNVIDRATVQAKNEARTDKGLNVRQRAKDLIANPSAELKASAEHDALVSTFNNSNKLSEAIKRARSTFGPGANFAIDLVMPFDRTPTNVIARILEASPYGFARNAKQAAQAARRVIHGEAGMSVEQQRDFARTFGRATTGSSLMALGWYLAGQGILTGLAPGPNDRKKDKEAGLEPNSIRIGGKWLPIGSLSPTGNILTIGAGLYREAHRDKPGIGKMVGTALQPLADQPLLKGVNQVADVLRDPSRGASGTAASFAFSFAPFGGAMRDVAKATDPEPRRVPSKEASFEGFKEQIQQNVPGWRRKLPTGKVERSRRPVTDPIERANRAMERTMRPR